MSDRAKSHDQVKRVIELVAIPLAILILVPLFLLVAAAVLISDGRPLLYRGARVGKGERIFMQFKFRTMIRAEVDENGRRLTDEQRISAFGRVLRKTSLDELPQLFNVLFGHMSLIGPRPLPVAYLERYSVTERRRHEVRPGLTGLAQSCGRNGLPWTERFALDVEYVDSATLRTDLRILVQTARIVVLGRDVSAPGYATAPEFLGVTATSTQYVPAHSSSAPPATIAAALRARLPMELQPCLTADLQMNSSHAAQARNQVGVLGGHHDLALGQALTAPDSTLPVH